MTKKTVDVMAKEHAAFFAKIAMWVYEEAFTHGYNHGKTEAEEEVDRPKGE